MSEYRLVRELGRGGMAVVYEAERILPSGISIPAACKAIHPEHCEDAAVIALFCREASVCLEISTNHPNLVTVFDFFRDQAGRMLLAMELVEGVPLSRLVKGSRLPYPAVRRIVYETLAALAYVHGCGVLHRDVSPDNILISVHGEVKLSDFGLTKVLSDARPHAQPVFEGKAPYASPEAIQCLTLDARSDLWSLAALAHELLSGEPPFGHGDILRIFSVMTGFGPAPLPDDVPEDLRLMSATLSIMEPDERPFATASALVRLLDEHAGPMLSRAELGEMVARARRSAHLLEPVGAMAGVTSSQPVRRAGVPPTDLQVSAPVGRRRRRETGIESWWRWLAMLAIPTLVLLVMYLVLELRRHGGFPATPGQGAPGPAGGPGGAPAGEAHDQRPQAPAGEASSPAAPAPPLPSSGPAQAPATEPGPAPPSPSSVPAPAAESKPGSTRERVRRRQQQPAQLDPRIHIVPRASPLQEHHEDALETGDE